MADGNIAIVQIWDMKHPACPFVLTGPAFEWRVGFLKEIEMTDIVERLNQMRTEVDCEVVDLAIAEIMRLRNTIEQLRSVVGLATIDGQTFAQIKQEIRNPI